LRLWLRIKGKNRLIPLASFIEPANVYEGNFLCPMIRNIQNDLSLHIDIVVADMGYISSDHKEELRTELQTAVITKVRENMLARKNMLIMVARSVPRGSLSPGMAMTPKPKPIDMWPQWIMLLAGFADYPVIVTKRFLLPLKSMNTVLESFRFIRRFLRNYCSTYAHRWKGALKTTRTNYL